MFFRRHFQWIRTLRPRRVEQRTREYSLDREDFLDDSEYSNSILQRVGSSNLRHGLEEIDALQYSRMTARTEGAGKASASHDPALKRDSIPNVLFRIFKYNRR